MSREQLKNQITIAWEAHHRGFEHAMQQCLGTQIPPWGHLQAWSEQPGFIDRLVDIAMSQGSRPGIDNTGDTTSGTDRTE